MSPEMELNELISLFQSIAIGESAFTANNYLELTNYNVEEAIQLFFAVNQPPSPPPSSSRVVDESSCSTSGAQPHDNEIPPFIPPKLRDISLAIFDSVKNPDENPQTTEKPDNIWKSDTFIDRLTSLYSPPHELLYDGTLDMAKIDGRVEDKWIILNVQSTKEFSSHMLNRDTWSNEALAETIRTNFIFFQVEHDSTEGKLICDDYKISSFPTILVIDPITEEKKREFSGMVEAATLLEDLVLFMDVSPEECLDMRMREAINFYAKKISKDESKVLLTPALSSEDVKGKKPLVASNEESEVKESEVEEVAQNKKMKGKMKQH